MSKGIAALNKEIRKKEHRASPLGQIEKKLYKFYGNPDNRVYFEAEEGTLNPHTRWVDIHRATTISKQKDLEIEFEDKVKAMELEYADRTDQLLREAMEQEYDYLLALQHGN